MQKHTRRGPCPDIPEMLRDAQWISTLGRDLVRLAAAAEPRREKPASDGSHDALLRAPEARARKRRLLLQAVLSLPDREREVILRTYARREETAAIAKKLQVTPSVVSHLLKQGRCLLIEKLNHAEKGSPRRWAKAFLPILK